jgi:hypothetical protein
MGATDIGATSVFPGAPGVLGSRISEPKNQCGLGEDVEGKTHRKPLFLLSLGASFQTNSWKK